MRKIIALSTMVAASASFAAGTTSTKKIDVSQQSLKERISFSWFAEALKDNATSNSKDSEVYNSISMKFKVSEKMTAAFNPRFTIQDSTKDQVAEHDLRLGLSGQYLVDGISTNLQFVVPTTAETTENANLITQLRFSNSKSIKIDSFNAVNASLQFRRNINKASVTSQSEYALYPGLTYTNNALSEKYTLRMDWEHKMSHVEGKALNHMIKSDPSERIVAGVDMSDTLGMTSFFPYLAHVTNKVKSTDQLSIGAQIYKSF
jgi:hypothetical protein